ncbi:hypothetical protein HID58_009015, partial [Brassica napus]
IFTNHAAQTESIIFFFLTIRRSTMVAYQTFFSDVNTGRRFNTGVTRLLRFWKARNITKVGRLFSCVCFVPLSHITMITHRRLCGTDISCSSNSSELRICPQFSSQVSCLTNPLCYILLTFLTPLHLRLLSAEFCGAQ